MEWPLPANESLFLSYGSLLSRYSEKYGSMALAVYWTNCGYHVGFTDSVQEGCYEKGDHVLPS